MFFVGNTVWTMPLGRFGRGDEYVQRGYSTEGRNGRWVGTGFGASTEESADGFDLLGRLVSTCC